MKAKDMILLTHKMDMILSELDDLRTLVIRSTADDYKKLKEEQKDGRSKEENTL